MTIDREMLRDNLAQSIYGTVVKEARKLAQSIDPDNDRIRRVFLAALKETDRSAAILVFALAEDMMAEGLKRNLNNKIKGGWESAIEPTGLLGTAANRIALLHMLDWIRPSTANDLLALKSIRNRFAHHAELDGFEDQKIRSWIANLTRIETQLDNSPLRVELMDRPFAVREQYIIRSCSVITRMTSDLIVGPIARKFGADPNDVVGRDFADLLPALQDTHRVLADVVISIAKGPDWIEGGEA